MFAHRAEPRPARILVVDDEMVMAELVVKLLRAVGYEAEAAADGHEALKRLSQAPYDLVITDLKMPGLDGRELYRYLLAHWPALAQRFLVATADIAAPETQRFLRETGVPYLVKPFPLPELTSLVGRVLDSVEGRVG